MLAATISPAPTYGGIITFASGDGVNEGNTNRTWTPGAPLTPGANVLITPNPAWEPNHEPGGKWISYGVGDGTGVVPPNHEIDDPYYLSATANFFETFYINPFGDSISSALLSVWADDTAAVYINKTLVQPPYGTQGSACADGVIGCIPTNGLVNVDIASFLKPGWNLLTVSAFQRGSSAFGVLYEGQVVTGQLPGDPSEVPEPATMGLLGAGLTGLIYLRRKFGISKH